MPPQPPPHFLKAKRRMRLGLLPAVMAATERAMRTRTGAPPASDGLRRAQSQMQTAFRNQRVVNKATNEIGAKMQSLAGKPALSPAQHQALVASKMSSPRSYVPPKSMPRSQISMRDLAQRRVNAGPNTIRRIKRRGSLRAL